MPLDDSDSLLMEGRGKAGRVPDEDRDPAPSCFGAAASPDKAAPKSRGSARSASRRLVCTFSGSLET